MNQDQFFFCGVADTAKKSWRINFEDSVVSHLMLIDWL